MRFSTVRQVGLFFGAAHSTAECSWLAYDINAGIVQHPLLVAILVPLRSYFFFFLLDLQPERLFKLAFTDGCCPLTKPCPFVFINPFHNRFWSCYHTFSVAKLVCSRARLKSLGQWRSFTNLPLSSLWFWRLALTKIKRI